MRCLYREKIHECGDYLEVDIYPVFKKQKGRQKRAKPTSEVQAKLNEHNAEQKLIRLLHCNFTCEDIEIHLTYSDDNLPENEDESKRDVQNYLRRVKRIRKKLNLPELKYISVTEGGVDNTRYHHHITMSGGVERGILENLWGYGYANARKLQFNERGVEGLARYITKQFRARKNDLVFRKRWNASKNLEKPLTKEKNGRVSQKKVKELATFDSENREKFENLYPGYFFSGCSPFYNEFNKGYYLCVRMYKKNAQFSNIKKRKRINSA